MPQDVLERSLELAGSNRAELEEALDWCIQKPFAMQAMRFVVGNLPTADLGKITADELIENYELAQAMRYNYAFGRHYDDAVWAHFVLPPRVSQEPLSEWRSYLSAQLAPRMEGIESLDEAALEINRWCGENAGFKQTQRRDQHALATLTSGFGRCEELCILYIAACRSVGVPARMAACPFWAVSDNNHAWVEVLGEDGNWHFVGAAEPADALDKAWFEGAAKQAPVIVSSVFGLPAEMNADVVAFSDEPGARYHRLNSTRYYRDTGWLEVRLPQGYSGEWGAEDELPELHVQVFNFGALRDIASVPFNDEGIARIELGAGTYALSSNFASGTTAAATVTTGETTSITLIEAPQSPGEFMLSFPKDSE